jgi:hypothetical protein
MRSLSLVALLAAGCGPKPYLVEGPQREGLTECGGDLSLLGDWEQEKPGELKARDTAATVERIPIGIRVGIKDGQSFVIAQAAQLAPVVAVGDAVDVAIRCEPDGWSSLGCYGRVLANDRVVAFNQLAEATKAWTIKRGPLLERTTHRNYGPRETYGRVFSHGGATVVSPLRGCAELITAEGTFRVEGRETTLGDPRAPDSSDTSSFSVIRVLR